MTALTWVGTAADADFMTADNWSPAQQPTTSDSCTINSTSNRQPSILTNATCGSLTLGTGASLMTLSFTAAKNFDITGDVTIGSNGRLAASGGLYNGVITVGGNWTDPAGTTNLLPLVGIILLGTAGLSAPGTLYAAMTAQARAKQALLPLLLFPLVVPALLASVRGTSLVLRGDPMGQKPSR